jgi:hypothetical protein
MRRVEMSLRGAPLRPPVVDERPRGGGGAGPVSLFSGETRQAGLAVVVLETIRPSIFPSAWRASRRRAMLSFSSRVRSGESFTSRGSTREGGDSCCGNEAIARARERSALSRASEQARRMRLMDSTRCRSLKPGVLGEDRLITT